MENNEIVNVDNSFISRIIKKIILFLKKKNDFDNGNSNSIQYKTKNNNELMQDNSREEHDFRVDLKVKDNKRERIAYLRKKYEENENCVKEFTDEEIDELIKLYKSESDQLRKEIEKYE